jgi:LPXTG-site transpeptidase (sortase) family protein
MPQAAKPEKSEPTNKRIIDYLPTLLLVWAVVVVAAGPIIVIYQRYNNVQAAKRAAITSAAPITKKPAQADIDNYTVAPDMPRYLTIPKLGVKARVQAVGLTKDGAIGSPSNVYDTAWYTGTSKPGQPGVSLIDGHVSSWTTKGVFYKLGTLQSGDTIQVTLGNNTVLSYTVIRTQTYTSDNVDMTALLSPVNPAKPGLNLITCAGDVIKGTNQFDRRVVVFAEKS